MTPHSLQRRVDALQAKRTPALGHVFGWQDIGEPGIDEDTVELCTPDGTNEPMTLDEWHRRYPDGTLIRIVYGEQDGEP